MSSARHNGADNCPPAVLVHILQLVPVRQRLGNCAAVSTAWAAAAVAATAELDHRFPAKMRAGHAKAVLRWVGQHAQHVTSLRLLGQDKGAQQLPFCKYPLPGLQSLYIQGVTFPPLYWWPAAADTTAAAPDSKPVHPLLACQHLTRLELVQCMMLPSLQVLMALTLLTDLRHLRLAVECPLTRKPVGSLEPEQLAQRALPKQMWEGLTKLTHLDLAKQVQVDTSVMAHLTHISGLQELRLNASMLRDVASLFPLQQLQCLTSLHINACLMMVSDDPGAAVAQHMDITRVFASLTRLSHLALVGGHEAVHLSALAALTGLQGLHLQPYLYAVDGGAKSELLAALSQCTTLTELRLSRLHWQPLPPAAAYAALTASTSLRCLELVHSSFPEGAWQQVFAAGRQLRALQELKLGDITGALTASDLDQLVTCCPGLTSLSLKGALQYGVTLHPLMKLSGLHTLALVHGKAGDAVDVLQQLTGLRNLSICNTAGPLNCNELLELTVLTQLTKLTAEFNERRKGSQPKTIAFTTQVPPCFLPDVWRQIQEAYKPSVFF